MRLKAIIALVVCILGSQGYLQAEEEVPPIAKDPLLYEMVVLVHDYDVNCISYDPHEAYQKLKEPQRDCSAKWQRIVQFMYDKAGWDP